MVKIEFEGKLIEINPEEYTGNMDEFLKKIIKKWNPFLSDTFYETKLKGKFLLKTRDGIQLNSGIRWRGQNILSKQDIDDILKNRGRLTLSPAPMANTPEKDKIILGLEEKVSQMKEEMINHGIDHSKEISQLEKEIDNSLKKKSAFVQGNVKKQNGGKKKKKRTKKKKSRKKSKKRTKRKKFHK